MVQQRLADPRTYLPLFLVFGPDLVAIFSLLDPRLAKRSAVQDGTHKWTLSTRETCGLPLRQHALAHWSSGSGKTRVLPRAQIAVLRVIQRSTTVTTQSPNGEVLPKIPVACFDILSTGPLLG
ncbi:hypothetical protein K470DRAFT_258293 [Piedraia hortae CBS 480.64]|uniref:Uncharacterized protein n=1 Tax=Piedraia hortae CBS 480.64 TaxID=1314780 RepID=A0A6A7BXW7_9PEZI|nr:hypothetical protein K470DRAFT_258293 [Piedraia hortae CBS 480.64]